MVVRRTEGQTGQTQGGKKPRDKCLATDQKQSLYQCHCFGKPIDFEMTKLQHSTHIFPVG